MAFVCRHPNVSGGGRKIRLVRRRRRRHPGFCATGRRAGYLSAQRSKSLGHRILTDLKNLGLWLRLCGQAVSLVRRVLVWSSICWLDPGVNHGMKLKTTPQKETSAETGGATRIVKQDPGRRDVSPFFPTTNAAAPAGGVLKKWGLEAKPVLEIWNSAGFPVPPPSPFVLFDGPSASLQEDGCNGGGSCWCCCSSSCEAMPGDLSMIFTANAGTGDFPDRPAFWNGEARPTAVKRRGGGAPAPAACLCRSGHVASTGTAWRLS